MHSEIPKEQTIGEASIFKGRVIEVKRLTVALENGRETTREVVLHPGAVAIVAEPEPDRVVLVKQYRKACEDYLWEIPAGKLEPGENPEAAAIRELSEETGYVASHIKKLYAFYTSPGFSNERLHVYYASHLQSGDVHLDEDEFVEMRVFSRDEVEKMIQSGEIEDAKTIVGLLWWCHH